MNNASPCVSVVIPTMGRATVIFTVESLLQTRRTEEIEIIIVGSIHDSDVRGRIVNLADTHPQVHYVDVSYETGDSSRKKNRGAEVSKSDIIAFLDDDVKVAPDWVDLILEPFKDPATGLVSGPSLVPPDISLMGRLAGLAMSSKAAGYVAHRYKVGSHRIDDVKWSRIIGCNMAYRRSVFFDMGTFKPEFWPGEEMIASYQTEQRGHKLQFASDAWVYHYPRQTLGTFLKQMYGYGATRIRLIRGGVEFEPATIVPGIWLASLVLLGVGSLLHHWFAWLLLLDVLLYSLVDVWITAGVITETKKLKDLLLLLLIPLVHLSYGWAEWVELFNPDRDLSENLKKISGGTGDSPS